MKAIIALSAAFLLTASMVVQPVGNEERPLPLVSATQTIKNAKPEVKVHPRPAPNIDGSGDRKKIAELIKMVQPRKGQSYADQLADTIVKEAKRYKLDPLVVATTAYIESEFNMVSQPCIGIMQVERRTYRASYAKSGLNPYNLKDNVRLGAWELADKAKSVNRSRVALASRGTLSRMWGRYNGAGPNSSYVRKAFNTYNQLKKKNPEDWKKHLKSKGPLWKKP
jgi:soluble lytic murein transglycosylase-like protein